MAADFFKLEYLLAFPIYILVILFALFLHEMGHYAAAKIFKIPIHDVEIGRGKLLKSWKNKRGVEWRWRFWPVGAHVHLTDIESRPFYQKILTIIAGPFTNIAIIPLLFIVYYAFFGQPAIPNIVVGVEQGLVADKAGIKPGDQFIAVNGQELRNYDEVWHKAYELGPVENTFTVKRNDKIFDVRMKPDWAEYNDLLGVPRKNARLGISWMHSARGIETILKVNGIDVEGDKKHARELLVQNFDKSITLQTESPLDNQNPITFSLLGNLNQGLLDEESDYYDAVFLGTTNGNIYMRYSPTETIQKAVNYSARLIWSITKLPFQIFPIDRSVIKDKASVTNPETWVINKLYALIHLFAVASIVIGLMNLLPFPNLDGGQLIDQILKKIHGEELTNKFRANIFALAFALIYGAIFIFNMDNLYGYVDSSVKKVHEWKIKNITNIKNGDSNG